MRRVCERWTLVALLVACLSAWGGPLAQGADTPDSDITITRNQEQGTISVSDRAGPILQYRFDKVRRKPYVSELYSPKGVQVLRDSPHDHVHHHALMFAVAVDGVDFWSETDDCGIERNGSVEQSRRAVVHHVDWVDARGEKPLAVERRTLRALRVNDPAATLVTWRTRLEPPSGTDSITLSGSHYFGLGMRLVQSMDQGGRMFNASGKAGELVRGSERVVPAKWCAYTAKADGKPVTVALFDDPRNPRHPATMFTMTDPFAYLSATLNLWKQPLPVKSGEPLRLRYGVAVWDGEISPDAIERLYQQWSSPPRQADR